MDTPEEGGAVDGAVDGAADGAVDGAVDGHTDVSRTKDVSCLRHLCGIGATNSPVV